VDMSFHPEEFISLGYNNVIVEKKGKTSKLQFSLGECCHILMLREKSGKPRQRE